MKLNSLPPSSLSFLRCKSLSITRALTAQRAGNAPPAAAAALHTPASQNKGKVTQLAQDVWIK